VRVAERAPFWLGVALTERAEQQGRRGDEPVAAAGLEEARDIFERLRATPWIARVDGLVVERSSVG